MVEPLAKFYEQVTSCTDIFRYSDDPRLPRYDLPMRIEYLKESAELNTVSPAAQNAKGGS